MSGAAIGRHGRLWLMIALGLAIVGVANWHLVSVASTSQPDCVVHVRPGDGDGAAGRYSAAQSACSPAANRLEAR